MLWSLYIGMARVRARARAASAVVLWDRAGLERRLGGGEEEEGVPGEAARVGVACDELPEGVVGVEVPGDEAAGDDEFELAEGVAGE